MPAEATRPPARNARRDYAMSRPAFLDRDVSQFGWSAVSPSRPALSQSAARNGRQGKRAAARSHAQPPLCGEHGEHGEHWTLMAVACGATVDQAGCVRTSASASHNPYSASGSGSAKPSKSVTATPSISVILLMSAAPFSFTSGPVSQRMLCATRDRLTARTRARRLTITRYYAVFDFSVR